MYNILMKLNSVRIVAGQFRGRKVLYSESDGLRPTSDRVRENLFNILQNDIPDAAVLDLFSGTGAFGLEALSRGAAFTVFADKNGECIKNIKQNIDAFKIEANRYSILHSDYIYAVKMLSNKAFDVVYIDPPFDSGLYTDCIAAIIDGGVVDKDGIIVAESNIGKPYDLPDTAEETDLRIYGTVMLRFIKPKTL